MLDLIKRFIKVCPKTGRLKGLKPLKGFSRFLIPLFGFIALLWILFRVIPKPSRAEYPCIKAATPIATGFLVYIVGLAAAIFSFQKAGHYFKKSKYTLASFLILSGITVSLFTILKTDNDTYAVSNSADSLFVPSDPPNTPMGMGNGIFPGRVVWIWDSTATSWNGQSGFWWDDNNTDQETVDSMLSKSLRALSGKSTDTEAWDALFRYFNAKHDKENLGYQPGEKIAIKINLNQMSEYNFSNPGNASFPSPQVILSLIRQLVYNAGVQAEDITFYDSNRYIPNAIFTKCKNEFPGVHFMGWRESNGRERYVRDTTNMHWSEDLKMEINGGQPAYLPTAVTQADYLINLANFKGHRYVGVTFCSKNHFGTISCDDNTGSPYQYAPHAAGLHPYVAVHDIIIPGSAEWTFSGRPMGTYNALVDLMGHKDLGGKTFLFLIDALYAAQTEGSAVTRQGKWVSAPFNNDWTSSLFLSQDNVAIESVGLDFFRTEAGVNPDNDTTVYGAVDNYLHEAALADNPPSGTVYDPEADGFRLQSLGVHEHWNNSVDKQYSRDLGTGEGIELVYLGDAVTSVKEKWNPTEFILLQNYPNPFNPTTSFEFRISKFGFVTLKVFDLLGGEVATLISEEKHAGEYKVEFSAIGRGKNLASGIYFARLIVKTGNSKLSEKTIKMVMTK
jgi:hypothetical protein